MNTCDKCGIQLHFVPEDEPWHPGYLICPQCDGTYNVPEREDGGEPNEALGEDSWLVRAKVQQPGQACSARRHIHQRQDRDLYRVQGDRRDAYATAMGRAARVARAGNTRGLDG